MCSQQDMHGSSKLQLQLPGGTALSGLVAHSAAGLRATFWCWRAMTPIPESLTPALVMVLTSLSMLVLVREPVADWAASELRWRQQQQLQLRQASSARPTPQAPAISPAGVAALDAITTLALDKKGKQHASKMPRPCMGLRARHT